VHASFVDRVDGGIRICVRSQEGALGKRVHLHGFREEIHPVHLGHALVGKQ
jgi:hypothetical protein